MQSLLYGVEENIHCNLRTELENYVSLKPNELLKKIYKVKFIVNYESDQFTDGYLLITNFRLIFFNDEDGEIFSECIQELYCLIVYCEEELANELIIKSEKEDYTSEILIKSKRKIKKIMKKISKYYEYNTQVKLKVFKSFYPDFQNSKCIEYLNLCYADLIKTFTKNSVKKYKLKDFKKLGIMGEGSNGKVFLLKHKKENKLYAAKVISKWKIIKEEGSIRYIRNEKFVLEHIQNDFLLSLKGFFQTERNLYLLTESMETDLYGLLKIYNVKHLSEEAVAFYSICTAVGLQCLHDHNYTYRDLKPENILIDPQGYPILCDFGLSHLLIPTHKAYTMCGTPEFFAPEVIASTSYDERIDWWCLGILIYELLFGYPPYSDENTCTLYEKILNHPVEFPDDIIVSDAAKDLVLRLLDKNQDKRMGAKSGIYELLRHEFYRKVDIEKIIKKEIKPPLKCPKKDNSYFEEEIDENELTPLSTEEYHRLKLQQSDFDILN